MIIIRADGNARIGAGHLMRCLTIAQELPDRRKVCFVCADEESARLARERGFAARVLGSDYRDLPGELPRWHAQADLVSLCPHVLLVDSYFVTKEYLEALGAFGKVVLLDDLAEKAYPVDAVINYNAFAQETAYERLYAGSGCRLFIGSRYVPLRPQFRDRVSRTGEQVRDILITTGGGDQDNIAGQILETLERGWGGTGLRGGAEKPLFHVVTGRFNPHFQRLADWVESHGNVELCHDVTDMASLMAKCDLAVTAGGTTVYELASVGVPAVCFSYARNQEALVNFMGDNDLAACAGAFHLDPEGTLERIGSLTRRLMCDRELRERYSAAGHSLVDGQGAARLAEVLDRLAAETSGGNSIRKAR